MASQPRFTQSSLGTQLESNPLFLSETPPFPNEYNGYKLWKYGRSITDESKHWYLIFFNRNSLCKYFYFLKYHNVNLKVLIFHGYNKLTKYTFFDTVENISSGILIEIYLYTPVLIIFVHLSFAQKYIAGQFCYFTPHCHLSLHHFHQIGAFDFHRFILLPIFG